MLCFTFAPLKSPDICLTLLKSPIAHANDTQKFGTLGHQSLDKSNQALVCIFTYIHWRDVLHDKTCTILILKTLSSFLQPSLTNSLSVSSGQFPQIPFRSVYLIHYSSGGRPLSAYEREQLHLQPSLCLESVLLMSAPLRMFTNRFNQK